LQESGGGKLFTDIAFGLVGKSTGGPAKAAIVSSGLMGMISGAAVANVVTTGTFTIPLMKKTGYRPQTAGAVEAVASSGGQIMPPVMGAAAFMMAEMCGLSYGTVALSALFLALLYYAYLFLCVHLEAQKRGLKGLEASMLPPVKETLREMGHLLIPLVVLIFLIVRGQSPGKSVFWSIVLVVVVSAFRKKTRMGPQKIIRAMYNGALAAIPVAAACAGAGIITGVISVTGVGLRFSSILISFSGGHLLIMLFLAMVASVILGMGLPTSACYAILSVLTAPALIQIGVPPLAAHYFIFFFGCISTITPPVALSAYAAAGIAGANPMQTGWEAFRLGLVGFILPYLAVYKPALLLLDTPVNNIIHILLTTIAVVAMTFSVEGVRYKKLNIPERLIFIIPTIVIFFKTPLIVDLAATALCFAGFFITRKKIEPRAA
jgi:TRAP transporter 4TM/12TM fusion protein